MGGEYHHLRGWDSVHYLIVISFQVFANVASSYLVYSFGHAWTVHSLVRFRISRMSCGGSGTLNI